MYLNMLEVDKVIDLYYKCVKSDILPNRMMLNSVLEAALRKEDSDLVYEIL
jgi:hypothetical protein